MSDKPKFDPNQAFQVVDAGPAAGAKPKFDPSKAFDVVPDAPVSARESLLRGAGQGATLGFLDELSGLGGVLGNKLGRMGVDEIKSTHPDAQAQMDAIAQAKTPTDTQVYQQSRDEERKADLAAEKANPGTYLASSLAGGVANPGAIGLKGVSGALGAGALAGLGGGTGDLTTDDPNQTNQAISDAAYGAGTGLVGRGLAKALPKVLGGAQYVGDKTVMDKLKGKMGAVLGAAGAGLGAHVAGPMVGGLVGGGLGTAVGSAIDDYAPKVTQKVIDAYRAAGNSDAFGKFKPAIEKAAAQGPQALAIMSAVLGNNPEFKQTMGIK